MRSNKTKILTSINLVYTRSAKHKLPMMNLFSSNNSENILDSDREIDKKKKESSLGNN